MSNELLYILLGIAATALVGFVGNWFRKLLVSKNGAKMKLGEVLEIDTKQETEAAATNGVTVNITENGAQHPAAQPPQVSGLIPFLSCFTRMNQTITKLLVKAERDVIDVEKRVEDLRRGIVPRQMDIIDRTVGEATEKMKLVHLELLIQKTGLERSAAERTKSQFWYNDRMDLIYFKLKEQLRRIMHSSQILDLTTDTVDAFSKDKVKQLFDLVTLLIGATWADDTITVDEIRMAQYSNISLYEMYLKNMILQAWAVIKSAEEETSRLKAEIVAIRTKCDQDTETLTRRIEKLANDFASGRLDGCEDL